MMDMQAIRGDRPLPDIARWALDGLGEAIGARRRNPSGKYAAALRLTERGRVAQRLADSEIARDVRRTWGVNEPYGHDQELLVWRPAPGGPWKVTLFIMGLEQQAVGPFDKLAQAKSAAKREQRKRPGSHITVEGERP